MIYLVDGSISNQSDAYEKALMWTRLEFVTRTVREKLATVRFVFEEEDAPGAGKKKRGSTESDATDSSLPHPPRQGQDRTLWRVCNVYSTTPRSCHVVSRVAVSCAADVLYVKVLHKANQANHRAGAGAVKQASSVLALEATLLRCGIVPGPCRLAPLLQTDRGRRDESDSCSDDEVRAVRV